MSQPDHRRGGRQGAIGSDRSNASVLEPMIEFVLRQAAAGRTSSPITPIGDDEAVSMAAASRGVTRAPEERPALEQDVAASMASRHEERRRISEYHVPCRRGDHDDGDWSQAVMEWSGTLLRAREPVSVMLEHQDRMLTQRPGILTPDTVVEAVGLSWDSTVAASALNPGSWATYLFCVRTGPYAGNCVHGTPEPRKRGLPDGFDVVG